MKVITVNFLTCAIKSCKASQSAFPLHFRDAEIEQEDLDFQPDFVRNILPRIQWDALRTTARELGFDEIPETKPESETAEDDQLLKDLHRLLLETQVTEGKLVCGNCSHEYKIKDGIANFLLPSHLGMGARLLSDAQVLTFGNSMTGQEYMLLYMLDIQSWWHDVGSTLLAGPFSAFCYAPQRDSERLMPCPPLNEHHLVQTEEKELQL